MIVDMARADPEKCVITGDGLSQSYVGEKTSFQIRAYDETGERRWCGRDSFQVFAGRAMARKRIDCW